MCGAGKSSCGLPGANDNISLLFIKHRFIKINNNLSFLSKEIFLFIINNHGNDNRYSVLFAQELKKLSARYSTMAVPNTKQPGIMSETLITPGCNYYTGV